MVSWFWAILAGKTKVVKKMSSLGGPTLKNKKIKNKKEWAVKIYIDILQQVLSKEQVL